MRRLVEHVGGVHRWAATMVRDLAPRGYGPDKVDLGLPTEDHGTWFAEGAARLIDALESCDPDAPMWAWGVDQHARFWSRRMVHETGIHRADAELSLGTTPVFDEAVAIDGVDEFLTNLPPAQAFAPGVAELRGDGERIVLRAPSASWTIRLATEGFEWERGGDTGDVMVAANPSELYLFVWGRRKPSEVEVTGDTELLATWVTRAAI